MKVRNKWVSCWIGWRLGAEFSGEGELEVEKGERGKGERVE